MSLFGKILVHDRITFMRDFLKSISLVGISSFHLTEVEEIHLAKIS